jgi:predicted DNA-binding transcriptional regulator AlpA
MHPKSLIGVPPSMTITGHKSRAAFYERMKSDPTFPKPIKLGRSTRFVLEELVSWIESKILERDAEPPSNDRGEAAASKPL